MNPISHNYPDWKAILTETALRRQIPAEMLALRQVIQKSGFDDPMNQLIYGWQGRFLQSFRSSPHEQKVLKRHTYLLQQILLLAAPEEIRAQSLIEPNLPVPFRVPHDHPVIRHAVSWLRRRGDYYEKSFLINRPRVPSVPDEERMARLLQGRASRQQQLSEEKSSWIAAFDRQFSQRIAQHGAQIQRMLAPIRGVTSRNQQRLEVVDEIGRRDLAAISELSERIQNSTENAQNELSQLSQELDVVNASMDEGLARVENTLQTICEDDQESFQVMRRGIESIVRQNFKPIAEQIAADRQAASAQLAALHAQYQEKMGTLRGKIASLREETVHLAAENKQLQQAQSVTSDQLNRIDQREKALQQGIQETRTAIAKVREKEKPKWYATALKIGACVLINYAMPVDGVFFPDNQGFVFRNVINL